MTQSTNKETENVRKSQVGIGHRCNVCNFWFKLKELFDHPEMGFICYPDKARIERLDAADRRFEWELDQAGREQSQ